MNTKNTSILSLAFFVLLIFFAIIFREEKKIDCEDYDYQIDTSTSGIIIIPVPLDSRQSI